MRFNSSEVTLTSNHTKLFFSSQLKTTDKMKRRISIVSLGSVIAIISAILIRFITARSSYAQISDLNTSSNLLTNDSNIIDIQARRCDDNNKSKALITCSQLSFDDELQSVLSPSPSTATTQPLTLSYQLTHIRDLFAPKNLIRKLNYILSSLLSNLLESFLKTFISYKPSTEYTTEYTSEYTSSSSSASLSSKVMRQTHKQLNDHVTVDMTTVPTERLKLINTVTSTTKYNNPALHQLGRDTEFIVSEHMVYRYYAAVDWAHRYNGKRYTILYYTLN